MELTSWQITPGSDDATDFVAIVNQVICRLVLRDAPANLLLIKVDNWFGSKWLSFSGKTLGALGVWRETLTIPPFVPSRIVSQRKFIAPAYNEVGGGELIHRAMPSGGALTRRAAETAQGAAIVWYSGNSLKNVRGCLMVYVPKDDVYCGWYAAWAGKQSWDLVETVGIDRKTLAI